MGKPESKIENYFVKKSKENNCLCYKFTSPSNKGVPDRIIITPNGQTIYVELKSETGELSRIQEVIIEKFKERNAQIYVIDSKIKVDELFDHITKKPMRLIKIKGQYCCFKTKIICTTCDNIILTSNFSYDTHKISHNDNAEIATELIKQLAEQEIHYCSKCGHVLINKTTINETQSESEENTNISHAL